MVEVEKLTKSLVEYIDRFEEIFDKGEKPPHNDRTYFEEVRKEIEPMYQVVDEWEARTKDLVQKRKVKIHPNQVDATVKSLKAIALHSFYMDVRKRRYKDIKKSIEYVLGLLLKELSS